MLLLEFSCTPYQARTVVARKILLTYLDQHPESILWKQYKGCQKKHTRLFTTVLRAWVFLQVHKNKVLRRYSYRRSWKHETKNAPYMFSGAASVPRQACAWATQQQWGPEPGSIPPLVCTACRPLEPGTSPAACVGTKTQQTMVRIQKGPLASEGRPNHRLPVSSSRHKHFVKRELSMQVLLDDIDPFGIPRLIVQLLTEHTREIFGLQLVLCWTRQGSWRGVNSGIKMTPESFHVPRNRKKREGIKNWERHLTDLKLPLVLLLLDLPTRQIEPRASSEGRRNSLLAPQPHLEQSSSKFSC